MSFLTSKSLPRRTVLRGLGATVALPFLDAMVPALSVRALAAAPVHRFQAFYVPNGMAMEYWAPKGEGTSFELSPILEPLAPFRNQMMVLSGLDATWNYIHAGASGSFLTGTPRGGRNEIEIIAEVSMDQLLARHFGNTTQVASLELALDAPANAGACTGNLSCAYTHTISWRSSTQPLPMEYNPRSVFERLFGDSGSTERAAREARMRQHKSILDSVNGKLADLRRQLGPHDQTKVEQYTESIRDVERRIQTRRGAERHRPAGHGSAPGRAAGVRGSPRIDARPAVARVPDGSDARCLVHARQGTERQALPADWRARSASSAVASQRQPRADRADVEDQPVSRELFAEYLAKLRATPDGDGSLLDHMTILYGSGISNSSRHSGDNLPLMLVGGGAGTLKGGQHLKYADNLDGESAGHLMDKMGVPVEKLGGSTGKLQIDTLSGCKSATCESALHSCDSCASRVLLMGAAERPPLIDCGEKLAIEKRCARWSEKGSTSMPRKVTARPLCTGPATATISRPSISSFAPAPTSTRRTIWGDAALDRVRERERRALSGRCCRAGRTRTRSPVSAKRRS